MSKTAAFIVLYHNPCSDGWCALAVAHLRLSAMYKREDLVYMPVAAGKTDAAVDKLIKEYVRETIILSFDLSYTYSTAYKLLSYFPKARIFDHHVTTEGCFKKPDDESQISFEAHQAVFRERLIYDVSISGAMLAWRYFYPEVKAPALVEYVQDKDIWAWKLPDSRLVNSGISETLTTSPADTGETWENNVWQSLTEWCQYLTHDNWVAEAKMKGVMINNITNRAIKRIMREGAEHSILVKDPDGLSWYYKVFVVNTAMYISELGETAYKLQDEVTTTYPGRVEKSTEYRYDFVVMWRYDHTRGMVCVSMRARADHRVNLAQIGEKFEWKDATGKLTKGGGHKPAAGFETDLTTFMNWIGPRVEKV